MIKVRDCEILDLLPYTFKTPRRQALSRAFAKVRAKCYDTMSAVLFWGDIENASPALLDAMAAELDTPFYSTDLTGEQKKRVIAAAFEYNSKVGTVSSVEKLVSAAFGGGEVSEWFEYGGDPYYFKVDITNDEGITSKIEDFDFFFKMLEKVKNKRSKLEYVSVYDPPVSGHVYRGGKGVAITGRTVIPFDKGSRGDENIYSVQYRGGAVIVTGNTAKIPMRKYNTYEDIKGKTYDELKNMTYAEILYKKEDNK